MTYKRRERDFIGQTLNALCISALAILSTVAAHAETQAQPSPAAAPSSANDLIPEIIVTARKHSENIQTVPLAITAVTGDQLKNQSVNAIKNLQAPSLYLQQAFDDPQSVVLTLRGRKQNDATLAVDPSVGIYADGYYNPRSIALAGALLDINRIEVLRGPQGTLYGRNTTGGALSVYTNDPTHDLSGSVDVTGGNQGTWNVAGIINVPLAENIDARFVAQRGGNGGYGHDGAGHALLNDDSQYYRGKIKIGLGGSWSALLSGHYESSNSGGNILKLTGLVPADPIAGLPEGGATTLEVEGELGLTEKQALNLLHRVIANSSSHFYDTSSLQNTFSHVRRYDMTMTIEGDLADGLRFRSLTGYQDLWTQSVTSVGGVPVTIITAPNHRSDKYLSQEFQLLGGERTRFQWVVGAYGSIEKGNDFVLFDLLPALGVGTQTNDDDVRNTSVGVFAQATWEFAPDWHVTGGARYSIDNRSADQISLVNDDCAVPAPGAGSSDVAAQCPRRFEGTFRKPVWLASVDYRLTPSTLLYAKVATGYRSGGIQEGGSVTEESFQLFRPETNTEFEAGFKSDLLDHHLRLNVAGYFDKYHDLQVTVSVPANSGGFAQAVRNAAKANIWGIEAEADAALTGYFSIHLSGAYTHAKYTSYPDLDPVGNPIDRSNEAFPVPRWTFGVSPRFKIGDGVGTLTAQVDYNWQSKVVLDPAGARSDFVTQDRYGLLNARISQHIDKLNVDLAIFATNLTGKHYYDQAVNLEDVTGGDYETAAAPRLFGMEIIKKFGE